MRVFLAGPMQGILDFNYPLFEAVEAFLHEQGYEVYNPAIPGDTSQPASFYHRRDLPQIASCHGIVMLPGWARSRGARIELVTAIACGLYVYEFRETPSPVRGVTKGTLRLLTYAEALAVLNSTRFLDERFLA